MKMSPTIVEKAKRVKAGARAGRYGFKIKPLILIDFFFPYYEYV